ncbi:uncharacterized protein RJT20DRAFT_127023 [Scheffersomyces xylosifermentans]|uniref:uncharacterized protein n=1 Tax=Scheffersomyces xylosifermentans TaxID=1304137 RepID=UPI00315C6E4C
MPVPSSSSADWFDPIPIDEYRHINEISGENVPDEVPIDEPLGELDIRCGPILKLSGTLENGSDNYRGSIMLVVKDAKAVPSITYKIGPANKEDEAAGKIESGEFPGVRYYDQDGFYFFRFTIDLKLVSYEQNVKYYIENHYKKAFQFFIPAVDESMNVVSFSCNGFSLATSTAEYKSSLWFDVLKKHSTQHYHVMLGGGDQIYSDSVKLNSKKLQEWMNESSSHKKKHMEGGQQLLDELNEYYLNHYMKWFGKGFWVGKNGKTLQRLFPLTMSQIPSVNIFDDHDIIDGFGSYHDSTMASPVLSTVGNIAYKFYMLFQHQLNPEEKVHESDPGWILGSQTGPYIKQKNHSLYSRLGKEIALVGIDCRTERKLHQVVAPSSYTNIFNRLTKEIKAAPDIKHLLVMLGVPIFYPRLVWLEWLLTSTVLKPVRKLAAKGVINKGLVNEFDGDIEVLDDLNDHWCSKHHKRERNQLIRDLTEFGAAHGVRITILSGDVHLCCIGRFKSKYHHHPHAHLIKGEDVEEINLNITENPEHDPRLLFNVISSAIINAPPPDAMAGLLNKRSKIHHFDNGMTDEDILPIFQNDVDGSPRENKQFLNKRNWSDLIIAKQSKYKSEIPSNEREEVLRKFPQPISDGKELKNELTNKEADERFIKYPLYDDSLVTTLHVEKEPNNYDAPTADYEVLIPRLIGTYKLDRSRIKHLEF